MAAKNSSYDYSSLEAFEEAHRNLEIYNKEELAIRASIHALPLEDEAERQRLGAQLTACLAKVRKW